MGHPWWYILYNVAIWAICFLFTYSKVRNGGSIGLITSRNDNRGVKFLFLLFLMYSLFTFFGGDNARYEYFATEDYLDTNRDFRGIEPLYAVIAGLVGGNFLLWKLIVYGVALVITYLTLKRLNTLNYVSLFAFTLYALVSYGTTRGVLAYSVYLLGITFIASPKFILKLLGILLTISSISAHSSMMLPVFLLPLIFVKLDRGIIWILILAFPLFLLLFNQFYPYLFTNQDLLDTQTGYKLGVYTDEAESVGTGSSLLLSIRLILDYVAIIMGLYYSLKADSKGVLPKAVTCVVRIVFYVFYVAMLIRFSTMQGGEFISTRYVTLIPFLLYVSWPFMLNQKSVFTKQSQNIFIIVSILNTAVLLFMLTYYSYLGR